LFYKEFLAEREEVLKHKWLRSEDAGRDIGFDAALIDWVINHREKWVNERPQRAGNENVLQGAN
tara:strand:+ start:6289 stop:6480 length:192 start_codon:yes stop_codon:yes gene_type:complete